MTSTPTLSISAPSGSVTWKQVMAGLCGLLGSILFTLQSQNMNPLYTFDVIQTRVDAFIR